MKTYIEITFPENHKLKKIVLKHAFRINARTTTMVLTSPKPNEPIYLYDMKFLGCNDDMPTLMDHYNIFKFEAYMHKDNSYIKCFIDYKIYDRKELDNT